MTIVICFLSIIMSEGGKEPKMWLIRVYLATLNCLKVNLLVGLSDKPDVSLLKESSKYPCTYISITGVWSLLSFEQGVFRRL